MWEVTVTLPLTIQEPVALRPPLPWLQPQLRPPPRLPSPLPSWASGNHPWSHSRPSAPWLSPSCLLQDGSWDYSDSSREFAPRGWSPKGAWHSQGSCPSPSPAQTLPAALTGVVPSSHSLHCVWGSHLDVHVQGEACSVRGTVCLQPRPSPAIPTGTEGRPCAPTY